MQREKFKVSIGIGDGQIGGEYAFVETGGGDKVAEQRNRQAGVEQQSRQHTLAVDPEARNVGTRAEGAMVKQLAVFRAGFTSNSNQTVGNRELREGDQVLDAQRLQPTAKRHAVHHPQQTLGSRTTRDFWPRTPLEAAGESVARSRAAPTPTISSFGVLARVFHQPQAGSTGTQNRERRTRHSSVDWTFL